MDKVHFKKQYSFITDTLINIRCYIYTYIIYRVCIYIYRIPHGPIQSHATIFLISCPNRGALASPEVLQIWWPPLPGDASAIPVRTWGKLCVPKVDIIFQFWRRFQFFHQWYGSKFAIPFLCEASILLKRSKNFEPISWRPQADKNSQVTQIWLFFGWPPRSCAFPPGRLGQVSQGGQQLQNPRQYCIRIW